jgi:hypothetical protein
MTSLLIKIKLGTGLRIGDVHGEGSKISPAAKDFKQSSILVVSNTWDSTKEIKRYISEYLPPNQILDDKSSAKLMGRVRPVALFVEKCLAESIDNYNFDVNEYFARFYETLTQTSKFEWSLSYLFDQRRFLSDDYNEVMEILRKAVYFQLCFGFPYVVSADSDARLFEYAFGILRAKVDDEIGMNIVINEPFILQTAYNLLSKNRDFLKFTAELRIGESLTSQSRGYLWEVIISMVLLVNFLNRNIFLIDLSNWHNSVTSTTF